MNKPNQQGPDPELQHAVHRLTRTQLSPLEEVMFDSWANANQLEDHDSDDNEFDYRGLYKSTDGKVLPPGQLKNMTQQHMDIKSLMDAQKAHDEASPMKLMMDHDSDDSSNSGM